MVAADWLRLDGSMEASRLHAAVKSESTYSSMVCPKRYVAAFLATNSAATAKWRWTCSHVADAAPEWPALLAATTTATLMLRADPSYPTVALFHVSLTLRKILKRRAAESPTSRSE